MTPVVNKGAILMDCRMPALDGWEATRRIRDAEISFHVPIIASPHLRLDLAPNP